MRRLRIHEQVELAPFTTFGIGGPARYFAEAAEEDAVLEALEFADARSLPVFVLGGGSNILVADSGFPGLVLRMSIRGIHSQGSEKNGIVNVGAGENWDSFVEWCVERNWAGIECLSGIPGTLGGTPIQNVGAYGEEASEVILSVRTLDRKTSIFTELSNTDCGFTYRTSIFNSKETNRYLILSVTYALRVDGEPRMHYPDLQRYFADRSDRPSLRQVRNAVRQIRASKAMLLVQGDPDSKSVGSFFKNPIVSEEMFTKIEQAARDRGLLTDDSRIPRFPAPAGMVKVPAARLIELAGAREGFSKGFRKGNVGISSKHSLAIVNLGGATAREVVELMRIIQSGVGRVFGITLAPEPVFVGFDPTNQFNP